MLDTSELGGEEITVFKAVGLGVEDLAVAATYERVLASGVGREI